jgi:hypothetical protein
VTAVPEASEALQVAPQLMPPPVTVPEPVPDFCTLSVYWTGLTASKVAVTERLAVMVTLQVAPLTVSQPVQPANVEPAVAAAVSVTAVPEAIEALQVVPQLMPPPVTVPEPAPVFCTLSVKVVGAPPSLPPPQAARPITSTATDIRVPGALVVMAAPCAQSDHVTSGSKGRRSCSDVASPEDGRHHPETAFTQRAP